MSKVTDSKVNDPPPSYQASSSSAAGQPSTSTYPSVNPYPSTPAACPNPQAHVHPQQPILHPGRHDVLQPNDEYTDTSHPIWTPAPTDAIARARAQKRFLVALVWAFALYLFIGIIFGSSAAVIRSTVVHNGHKRHRHY